MPTWQSLMVHGVSHGAVFALYLTDKSRFNAKWASRIKRLALIFISFQITLTL